MQRWDRQWYGPVAAIRPYLFQKCFLLLVALDLLVLMVERGARYGLDAIPFNVPHFSWLDALHRLYLPQGVPTATYYVCVLVLTSFLAICLIVSGHRPWLMAIVTALYTYAWSMSRLDSYLHHYMLTLALSCMVFFPRIDARLLRDWWVTPAKPKKQRTSDPKNESKIDSRIHSKQLPHPPGEVAVLAAGEGTSKRQIILDSTHSSSCNKLAWLLFLLAVAYRVSLSQAVSLTTLQRWLSMFGFAGALIAIVSFWIRNRREGVGPTASAWAYRLLGTTVGVIYVFTSIAKMDIEWCGGHTLRQVGTTADVLLPVEQLARSVGLLKESFWSLLATFVIPLELTLAFSYFVAIRQDEPNRTWLRRWCFFAWLLAIGLHLNNEMMNLIIQWFGYYMLLFATIILLPARILMVLGVVFFWPECWARERYERTAASLSNGQAAVVLGTISLLAMVGLLFFGYFTWIAGAIVASLILAAGLVLVLVSGMVAGWERKSIKIAVSALLASIIMTVAVAQCSMRFDYYDLRGKTLQQLGRDQMAVNEMELATALPFPSKKAAAELYTNLGLSYRRMNHAKKAEATYRKAIGLDPEQFLAHYSLGNLLVQQQRHDEAERHYRRAVELKPDFSDAYVNLGNVLEFKNQLPTAIACYETAAIIEPNAEDIKQMLNTARKRLAESQQ